MPNPSEAWLLCRDEHHRDAWAPERGAPHNRISLLVPQSQPTGQAPPASDPTADLQRRLDNANAHFRRKAAEVLTDASAVRLMAVLYQEGVVELANVNSGELGIPLAKVAAARFCEIGVSAIWITQSGERFVGSIIPLAPARVATPSRKTPPTQTADNTL